MLDEISNKMFMLVIMTYLLVHIKLKYSHKVHKVTKVHKGTKVHNGAQVLVPEKVVSFDEAHY